MGSNPTTATKYGHGVMVSIGISKILDGWVRLPLLVPIKNLTFSKNYDIIITEKVEETADAITSAVMSTKLGSTGVFKIEFSRCRLVSRRLNSPVKVANNLTFC